MNAPFDAAAEVPKYSSAISSGISSDILGGCYGGTEDEQKVEETTTKKRTEL